MTAFQYTTVIERFSQEAFEEQLELTLSGYGAISGTEGGEWELSHFELLPGSFKDTQALLIFKK